MTTRRITPHKGGRTARIPSGWILPETLRRIHEAKREQEKSFSDLIEEKFSGGNTMEPNKVVRTKDNHANCPYCGEGYHWQADWQHLIEENPHKVTCDGEDGCGRDFVVIFEN